MSARLKVRMKPATRALAVGAAALGAVAIAAGPASASTDYYGAIAVSESTGNVGWVYDATSRAEAESHAVNKCGAGDCQSIVWVKNGCAAVAQAGDTSWSWGYAGNRADAESNALSNATGPGAHVVRWVCTTNSQT